MKKIKTKMLLGFGAMTALVTTGLIIISCGSSNQNPIPNKSDQQKLDEITSDMLKGAITKAMHPSTEVYPYPIPTGGKVEGVSINGVDNATITFDTWTTSWISGSLSFLVKSITKGSATVSGAKFGTITISGFKITTNISKDNINDAENNLWSWNDDTKTLTIFEGVTVLENAEILGFSWGTIDIVDVKSIILPGSLSSVGENAFRFASNETIKFNGSLPGTSGRTLSLGLASFARSDIGNIVDGDLVSGASWQAWVNANAANAFTS